MNIMEEKINNMFKLFFSKSIDQIYVTMTLLRKRILLPEQR